MKKWLSMLLLILLSQALPLNALATIGKVLTPEELAAATDGQWVNVTKDPE